jgi:hypothetical protein
MDLLIPELLIQEIENSDLLEEAFRPVSYTFWCALCTVVVVVVVVVFVVVGPVLSYLATSSAHPIFLDSVAIIFDDAFKFSTSTPPFQTPY